MPQLSLIIIMGEHVERSPKSHLGRSFLKFLCSRAELAEREGSFRIPEELHPERPQATPVPGGGHSQHLRSHSGKELAKLIRCHRQTGVPSWHRLAQGSQAFREGLAWVLPGEQRKQPKVI